jgi:large subunit ribosomal protein L22
MGSRKHNSAEAAKTARKSQYIAKLNDCPTSPRKMRLVADLIRGIEVERGLQILKHTRKDAAERLYKLLASAIANWQVKNEGSRVEEAGLYVKEIQVDGGRMVKRIRTAPQGRANRIRKRSNHVTLVLGDNRQNEEVVNDNQ